MTGGRAVIIGSTGRNFAAGMSGGVAYVLTDYDDFRDNRCNLGTVLLERVEFDEDKSELLEMLELHEQNTGSTVAAELLQQWPKSVEHFVKVMPTDYKRVLMERMEQEIRN